MNAQEFESIIETESEKLSGQVMPLGGSQAEVARRRALKIWYEATKAEMLGLVDVQGSPVEQALLDLIVEEMEEQQTMYSKLQFLQSRLYANRLADRAALSKIALSPPDGE